MSFGTIGVDYEIRVNFDRLRKERLERAKAQLKKGDLGAFLCFDPDNIRYITSTHAPLWTRDKMTRYCILPRDADPVLFDVGHLAAVRKDPRCAPWLGDRVRPAISWCRGAAPKEIKGAESCVAALKKILTDQGVADEPVGLDIFDVPLMKALNNAKIEIADGQSELQEARSIKTEDEIELMNIAAMMVDAAFDRIARAIRPGVKENELVALVNNTCFLLGAEEVSVNCESGPRTNPHHHDFSDRAIRPGDLVFLDIHQKFNGYMTCYYRTFSCGKPTQEQKDLYQDCLNWLQTSIKAVKPGATTADIAKCWPGPEVLGLKTEQEALANQWGHGLGLSLWEIPIVSRAFSLEYPYPIKKNMVFALETYAGPKGGKNGVRIEDELVVTDTGAEVITKYPRDELIACGT